ncbi:Bacitracin transport ATP-binding protein BcrA [Tetragenococcus halophilus subsp. flandriensis]|nr:Bacitracin transport ATP-binding protein BcrA [Tetragenococcus halophilus subsp. flandriensis]
MPKSSIEEALSIVGMSKWKDRQAKKYSLGMKQRLGLASALIGKPPILILDEPTNGLDPVGVHEIRTLIQTLPEKLNCTVLLSSHLLSEIELVADTIGIMNHGNLLFEGTIDELKINFQPQDQTKGDLEETFLKLIQEDNRRRGLSDE